MPTLIINGARLKIQLVEVEISRLKLDPENPRLHSSYLTHELQAQPSQIQIARTLESLPEFESLYNSIAQNNGCFHPPVVTADLRVLEGNRRVTALRRLRSENSRDPKWKTVTVQKIVNKLREAQEKAIRAKYHLDGMLAWDGLSQLTEYLCIAERDGPDVVARMLGRYKNQIAPLLVAASCVRKFSRLFPQIHSQEMLWVLVGLCGLKQMEPNVAFSRSTRFIYTADDEKRPDNQPYTLERIMQWLVEGKFTKAYDDAIRQYKIKAGQVPKLFKKVRDAGGETMAYFLEADGSLAKALAFLETGPANYNRKQQQAINLIDKFNDLFNEIQTIRKEENPNLYRGALSCYHRLGQLLNIERKERAAHVHATRH